MTAAALAEPAYWAHIVTLGLAQPAGLACRYGTLPVVYPGSPASFAAAATVVR